MGQHEELGPGLGSFHKGKFVTGGMRKVTTMKSSTQQAKEKYPANKVIPQQRKAKPSSSNEPDTGSLFFTSELEKLIKKGKQKHKLKKNKRR